MLTSYRGVNITYDEIGNPLSYYNGSSYTFTWENGRQLKTATVGSKNLSFTYNQDGIRTSKTVNGVVHNYTLSGSQILTEEWGNNLVVYLYDLDGAPIGMQYRNASYAKGSFDVYWFEKNVQGDIVAVYGETGTKLISYTYDAWGNFTTSYHNGGASTSAIYNAFTYRGYYYDAELDMYYLQSRYYDSNIGRFINADSQINSDLLGCNMFAYCASNPVMGFDPTGNWSWGKFFSGANLIAIGVSAIAVAATVLTCGAAAPAMVAVAAVTLTAGTLTAVNGVAEVVEAGTGTNFVRDTVFQGNDQAYTTYKNVMQTTAEIGTAICGTYYAAKGGNVCFVAGTLIATAVGHIAIEAIEAGDWVWATNPETGETELKQVVQTFVNEASELVHLTTSEETITATPAHPFYVPEKGWVSAIDLRAGDILVTVNGEYVVLEKVQHELLETPVTVYNFEVEGFHTYHVGEQSLLVHNACGKHGDLKKNMLKEGPAPGDGYQAHHGLPWADRDYFSAAGLDVNDARFGRWVIGGGNGGHQSWSYRYGQLWKKYIKAHPTPDATDIINYFNKLNGIR